MKRNKFSLSHHKLLTCDMGALVPIGLVEVLPGDSVQQATSLLLRASPLMSPVMHPVDVRIHHWFVPHRIIWDDWENFITGGPTGIFYEVPPYIGVGTTPITIGSLADYYGVPVDGVQGATFSALPFRGYNLIWNEFYRDQDLQTPVPIDKGNSTGGADAVTSTALLNCGWEKDYFTSARPWETKGTDITIPLTGEAPIRGLGWLTPPGANAAGGTPIAETGRDVVAGSPDNYKNAQTTSGAIRVGADGRPNVVADLSDLTAVTINQLREAMALQRFTEARARYGSRYTEYLRYLGVRSSDARLQRPEYLGGGRNTIQFSEVLQTGPGADPTPEPVGTLKGHGISAMRSNRYRRFFEEHGYIHSLLSVRPKTIYMDGMARHWSKNIREMYWQKELQHIGQQQVLNKEVYHAHANAGGIFGYQDRYDEYRRIESGISGEFRTTLAHWHFGRAFGAEPALNADFIKCTPPETPFASQNTHTLWIMAKHSIQARRMLAATGTSFIY